MFSFVQFLIFASLAFVICIIVIVLWYEAIDFLKFLFSRLKMRRKH